MNVLLLLFYRAHLNRPSITLDSVVIVTAQIDSFINDSLQSKGGYIVNQSRFPTSELTVVKEVYSKTSPYS